MYTFRSGWSLGNARSRILTYPYVAGTASRIDVVPVSSVRIDVLVQLLVLVRHPVPTGSNS